MALDFTVWQPAAMTIRKRTSKPVSKKSKVAEKKAEASHYFYYIIVLASITLTAGCYFVYSLSNFQNSSKNTYGSNCSIPDFIQLKSIKVLVVTPDEQFATKVSNLQVPVVIKNSITQTWTATKKWTPFYLSKKISKLSGIYKNGNRWFGPYYDTSKPLSHLSTRNNVYRTDVSMKGDDFFRHLEHPRNDSYIYFTGDIDDVASWAWSDVQPIQELLKLNPKHSSINVWMGQPHVIAHCHYDGYHNFYAQLYGRKKFTLFRPTEWPGISPYPFLHPSHAQAQVNLSDENSIAVFPAARHLEGYQVTLEPGDLLYMPPLWFHHVEAMDVRSEYMLSDTVVYIIYNYTIVDLTCKCIFYPSISINVWTGSMQSSVMEQIFALELPFQQVKWRKQLHKSVSTAFTIYSVISEVCKIKKCITSSQDKFSDGNNDTYRYEIMNKVSYFVHRLWQARYIHLFTDGTLPNTFKGSSILCEQDNSGIELIYELLELYYQPASLQYFIMDYSARVGKLAIQLPVDTWELWIGNYLEYIVANSVGPDYVGYFLQNFDSCFTLITSDSDTMDSHFTWWLPMSISL